MATDTMIAESPLHALRRKLAPPLVEMQARGETAMMPGARLDDVAFFIDPAQFAREQQQLFRDMPLVACLSADLPGPGSFRTFDDAARHDAVARVGARLMAQIGQVMPVLPVPLVRPAQNLLVGQRRQGMLVPYAPMLGQQPRQ